MEPTPAFRLVTCLTTPGPWRTESGSQCCIVSVTAPQVSLRNLSKIQGANCKRRHIFIMCVAKVKPANLVISITLLLLITSGLVVYFNPILATSSAYTPWLSSSPCFCEEPSESGKPGELTRTPPSAHLQVFHARPELEDMSQVGDAAWAAISSTQQGGFLWVRHNETYKTGHGVSMFHALHCLSIVRDFVRGPKGPHGSKRHIHHGKSEEEMHVGHCLSYIAQSLLCSADGTLERPKTYTDGAGNVLRDDVDGEDIKHQCRGSGYLKEKIMESERRPLESIPVLKDGATVWDLFEELG